MKALLLPGLIAFWLVSCELYIFSKPFVAACNEVNVLTLSEADSRHVDNPAEQRNYRNHRRLAAKAANYCQI